ncbi:MAG: tyrosine-type recombinase/integrase [Sinimarinibacterium flocculans]|uniref:tyrosine-type recombinase/integrase n=1 Tax=Sinimarinibacterium flocculans TaxID=985250 RepID=UPI003C68C256
MAVKLTELQVKNAKPRAAKYTMAAGGGLMLLVMPDGSRYWRLRYRIGGKAKMISVGRPYPFTTLKQALAQAAEFRATIAEGIDPADQRRIEKLNERERVANTFGEAADAWHAFRSKAWDTKTSQQARTYLDKDILPKLRSRPLDGITPAELGALVGGIEDRGAFDVAKKTRQWLKAIYSYARASGWTSADPARDLAAIAQPGPGSRNFAHLSLDELPDFLHALDQYDGSPLVKGCARLALWTANRPGVTRTLRWAELDLDAGIWTIEKGREGMKRGYYHLTPLPTQAVALLRDLQNITGGFEHVLIGRNDPRKPLSDGAVAGMFKRIGYHKKQTMHGFRHLISTALNDQGYQPDWVERQLAHGDPDKIRGTYNKAAYLDQRRKMMQDWADYLDRAVKSGTNVVQMRKAAA